MGVELAVLVSVVVGAMCVVMLAAILHSWRHCDTDLEMWRGIIGDKPKAPRSVEPTDAMELARRVSDD